MSGECYGVLFCDESEMGGQLFFYPRGDLLYWEFFAPGN
jgi:hypothetical protein